MYDILRYFKKIIRSQPPKRWYAVLGLIALILTVPPLLSVIGSIVDPPAPTATPRPTPDILQSGDPGRPLQFLDTTYALLGYQEYDSACLPLGLSEEQEPLKTAVIEFWARHSGEEPVELSSFYLRDAQGANYRLEAGSRISAYGGTCGEPLSEGIERPAGHFRLTKGYGSHIYLYSREIPAEAEGLQFTFRASYVIPYPAAGTETEGSSKLVIPLPAPGSRSGLPEALRAAPFEGTAEAGKNAESLGTAFRIGRAYRADETNNYAKFYLELYCLNLSDQMKDFDLRGTFSFAVVDAYGVAMAAEPPLNSGYNSAFAPGETQKYRIGWDMEEASLSAGQLYLRIRTQDEETPDRFIPIPAGELTDMKSTAAARKTPAPVQPRMTEHATVPAAAPPCGNALVPRLIPGDRAAVTDTPPVPNRLRGEPGTSGSVIGMLAPGTPIVVLEGPVCADGLYWYSVRAETHQGWTAESGDGRYWLEKR